MAHENGIVQSYSGWFCSERKWRTGTQMTQVDEAARRAGQGATNDAVVSPLFVNSVEKAFRVLSVFDVKRQQLSLSQIAAQAGLDMSAAQRFVYTLAKLGLLQREADSRLYSLAPRMLDFARQYIAGNAFVSLASPFLQQLSRETEETVNITALDGTEVIVLQRIVSRHVLTPDVIVGTRMPAYCTSSGLAILAALPNEEAAAVLNASNLIRHTQHTVNDRAAILARLEMIRETGYAHTEDELYLGDIATAAAVLDRDGRPMGAINAAVSRARWKGAEDERRIASLLLDASRAISRRN